MFGLLSVFESIKWSLMVQPIACSSGKGVNGEKKFAVRKKKVEPDGEVTF